MTVTFRFRNSGDACEYLFYDRYHFSGRYKFGLNIGCNDGLSTLSLSRFCDKVLSFEPNKAVFEIAKENLSQFGHEVFNYGFSDREEMRKANLLEIHNGVSYVDEEGDEAMFVRGDDLALSPDVIKIDAYFDAHKVLLGFRETLTKSKPDLYIATYVDLHQEKWVELLSQLGYTLSDVHEKAVKLTYV